MQYLANISQDTNVKVYAYETYDWQRISEPSQRGTRGAPTEVHFRIPGGQDVVVNGSTATLYPRTTYTTATVDPPASGGVTPSFGSKTKDGPDVRAHILVTTTLDAYGYPLSSSAAVESCTISHDIYVNGDRDTSPLACSLLQDAYSMAVNAYNLNLYLQPETRTYYISNYRAFLDPDPELEREVANLTISPVPGIGFIYLAINVGSQVAAFYSNYHIRRVWSNANYSGSYSLTIPLVDALGNPSFDQVVTFKATTSSGGVITLPSSSGLSFPGLRQNIERLLGVDSNTSIVLGLVLDNAGVPVNFTGVSV